MKKIIFSIVTCMLFSLSFSGTASAASTLHDWSATRGSNGGALINDNLYIIDTTGDSYVGEAVKVWAATDARIKYVPFGTHSNCDRVHCAYIGYENMHRNGSRTAITYFRNDAAGRWMEVNVGINVAYGWNELIDASQTCQAVGRALGLLYTRAANESGCMSSAFTQFTPNSLDKTYVNQLW